MQKIYFHKNCLLQSIVDGSGKKTLEQIKEEFGDFDYQVLELDESKDGHRIENGKLKKYSLEAEKEKARLEQNAEKKILADRLKSKFGFTEEDFEDLKKIIRQ